MRTIHYVTSTHWDREWYDTAQGFRIRLVAMLDEVLDCCNRFADFRFVLDGQALPLADYVEIRRERADELHQRVREGRIKVGPWLVLPDEFLVSGESLIRNLEAGMEVARELGAEPSRAGFVCDQFGHTSQLPQLLAQLGCGYAYLWRGTHEDEHGGHSQWQAPDGTQIAAHRFGWNGYGSHQVDIRNGAANHDEIVTRLVATAKAEALRTPEGPVLLFDGMDHMEIEPEMPALIVRANLLLAADGLQIRCSDLDAVGSELTATAWPRVLLGELRESAKHRPADATRAKPDNQWVIPGVASSRINLKQRNAACEDELTLWAEPFAAQAVALGAPWPAGYLRTAWRHLLENHPHDSICGCSIDAVHRDMLYRFDQSLDIAKRLTERALRTIASAAAPTTLPEKAFCIAVFNPVAAAVDEVIDLDVPLPDDWPTQYQEFFGFERKFGFVLRDADGSELPWQYVAQDRRVQHQPHRARVIGQNVRNCMVVRIAVRLALPAQGHVLLTVEPTTPFVRHLGSLAISERALDDGVLRVEVNADGTLRLTDHRTGRTFDRLLAFEDRSDIGDGWYHGLAVIDRITTANTCQVSVITDGPELGTLRLVHELELPAEFDFSQMRPSATCEKVRIETEVTLRRGSGRLEMNFRIDNRVKDHRLRVLFPTNGTDSTFLTDAAFDVIERPVKLPADNATRRELAVETQPQQTWAAYAGLAVVSRGQPEVAVCDRADRPLALTLFRSFRRAVMAELNANPDGQLQGVINVRCWLVPFAGEAPREELFRCGQRVLSAVRQIDVINGSGTLPRRHSGLAVHGAVVTARGQNWVRLFNPTTSPSNVQVSGIPATARATAIDGQAQATDWRQLPAKRITTLRW